ncbi:MAG TPA: PIN domain-containing protein [Terriglobales bacterium]|nr:PIN domain-containing protein [Terriglobales bacterium]
MSDLVFFDTNILVYTEDVTAPAKQKRAASLWNKHFRNGTALISVQVLQEYFSAVTRKLAIDAGVAQRRVEIFSTANVITFDAADVISAIELHRLMGTSFWDALILHAARNGGASVLYSEDFQHGAILASVRVVNPFL